MIPAHVGVAKNTNGAAVDSFSNKYLGFLNIFGIVLRNADLSVCDFQKNMEKCQLHKTPNTVGILWILAASED